MTNTKVLGGAAVLSSLAFLLGVQVSRADGDRPTLPEAAAKAVHAAFPEATPGKVDSEQESLLVYEVELTKGADTFDVSVGADGTVLAVERHVAAADLPAAVTRALAGLGEVKSAERVESRGELRVVALPAPTTVYEVKVKKDGRTRELVFTADGHAVAQDEGEDGEGDEHGEGGEHEGGKRPG